MVKMGLRLKRRGKAGEDKIVKVPMGTLVKCDNKLLLIWLRMVREL